MSKEACQQYAFGVNRHNEFYSKKRPVPVGVSFQSSIGVEIKPQKINQIGQFVFADNMAFKWAEPQMWIPKLKDGTPVPSRVVDKKGNTNGMDIRLAREAWDEAWDGYLKDCRKFEEHRQKVRSAHPELAALEDAGMCRIG